MVYNKCTVSDLHRPWCPTSMTNLVIFVSAVMSFSFLLEVDSDDPWIILEWGECLPNCPQEPTIPVCHEDPVFPGFALTPGTVNYTAMYHDEEFVPDTETALNDVSLKVLMHNTKNNALYHLLDGFRQF